MSAVDQRSTHLPSRIVRIVVIASCTSFPEAGAPRNGTLVGAAEQEPGGELVARLDQVEHLDLNAGEGRVEVLVEGDHTGLLHRLLRDAAEDDVVGVVEIPRRGHQLLARSSGPGRWPRCHRRSCARP